MTHRNPRQVFVRVFFGALVLTAVAVAGCGKGDETASPEPNQSDSVDASGAGDAGDASSHPGVAAASADQLNEMRGDREAIAVLVYEHRQMTGGQLPELSELTTSPERLIDPWGNPYRLVARDTERGFTIFSNGPDGAPDTDDDIDLAADIPRPPTPG